MKKSTFLIRSIYTTIFCTTFITQSAYSALTSLEINYQKTSEKFDAQISKKYLELESLIETVQKDQLFIECNKQWLIIANIPLFEHVIENKKMLSFLKKLYETNKNLIDNTLLYQVNNMLEETKNKDFFSSIRPILKKERVALVEVFEEADFLKMINRGLDSAIQEITTLISSEIEKIYNSKEFILFDEMQKKYLALPTLKKIVQLQEKIEALENQKTIALIKNKNLHPLFHASEGASLRKKIYEKSETAIQEKQELQKKLLLTPIKELF